MGGQPENCETDLKRNLCRGISMPEPFILKSKVFGKQKGKKEVVAVSDSPASYVDASYAKGRDVESLHCIGSGEGFWKSQLERLEKCKAYLQSFGGWRLVGRVKALTVHRHSLCMEMQLPTQEWI